MQNTNSISPWYKMVQEIKSNRISQLAVFFVVFTFVIAVLADFIAPHHPDVQYIQQDNVEKYLGISSNGTNADNKTVEQPESYKLLPPAFAEGGVSSFIFGTDSLGRDIFSRIIYGARISLFVGIVPVLIASLLGIPFGLFSGYSGGKIDEIMMRTNDCLLAFPSILLALLIVAYLGTGIFNLMIAIGLSYTPTFARVVRGAVVSEKQKEYVSSAVALGAGKGRILIKHLIPNIVGPVMVIFTMSFASAIIEAAGLSFLGLGAQPPTPEWGVMLSDGRSDFHSAWWLMAFPGFAIFLAVISLNIIGDTIRDALDPKTK